MNVVDSWKRFNWFNLFSHFWQESRLCHLLPSLWSHVSRYLDTTDTVLGRSSEINVEQNIARPGSSTLSILLRPKLFEEDRNLSIWPRKKDFGWRCFMTKALGTKPGPKCQSGPQNFLPQTFGVYQSAYIWWQVQWFANSIARFAMSRVNRCDFQQCPGADFALGKGKKTSPLIASTYPFLWVYCSLLSNT